MEHMRSCEGTILFTPFIQDLPSRSDPTGEAGGLTLNKLGVPIHPDQHFSKFGAPKNLPSRHYTESSPRHSPACCTRGSL